MGHCAETFHEWVELNERCHASEKAAREEYGDELINSALHAAQTRGVQFEFYREDDPYGALMQWF